MSFDITEKPQTNGKFVVDMSHDDYQSSPAVSRSGLLELLKSPQHYWWRYLSGKAEKTDTNALRTGSAFHTLLLEPAQFDKRVAVVPEDAPKYPSTAQWKAKSPSDETVKSMKWWTDFELTHQGKSIIKQSEFEHLQAMAKSILAQPAAGKIITANGKIEASFFYTDKTHGVEAKARPDYWRDDGIVLDLKTTADASESEFSKSIVNYGYDIQAFMQMEAIETVTGKRPASFVFICVEKDPPYAVAFYEASSDMLRCGEYRYHNLMKKYAHCFNSDVWPGYGHLIRPISVPDWFINRLDKQAAEGVQAK
jgi:hypothetical protein